MKKKNLKNNDPACEYCYDKNCKRTGSDVIYCLIRYLYYEPEILRKEQNKYGKENNNKS